MQLKLSLLEKIGDDMASSKITRRVFRLLIIEDDQTRLNTFQTWLPADKIRLVISSSAGGAIGILTRDRGSVYSGIMLDHDLQQGTLTSTDQALSGTNVVKAIIENVSPEVPVLVHSMNPSGSQRMMDMLSQAGFEVTRIPMDQLDKKTLVTWVEKAYSSWEDNLD